MAEVVDNKNKEIVEGSIAQDTMHPNTRPAGTDPKSKLEVLTGMIGAMHTMKKEDCVKWYDQMMASIGHEGDGVGAVSDKNKNSINAKPSGAVGSGGPAAPWPMPKLGVKEDVDEMFNGSDLSEEVKEKVTTLFEAAVTARVILETEKLQDEFETKVNSAIDEATLAITEELTSKVDTYINYVVENWMEENKVAVDSTLRAELMDEFIDGMKKLFVEHYIDIPSDKVNVVESLQAKVAELEATLNDTITENGQLKEAMVGNEKKEVFESLITDLALSEREKFERLAEGVEFTGDLENYATKLTVIKETYFKKQSTTATETNINEEVFEGDTKPTTTRVMEPQINRYVDAISRSAPTRAAKR